MLEPLDGALERPGSELRLGANQQDLRVEWYRQVVRGFLKTAVPATVP